MRILKTFLFPLILLVGLSNVANSSVYPLDLRRYISETKKTGISSFDFRVDVIEQNGLPLDAVTVTSSSEQRPLVPADNSGHLYLTSRNVFMTVTNGVVAMDLMAGNGTFVSLVASSGDSIEFEPYSFTITPSVTNTKSVAALIEGMRFSISPGESTRFVEIDTMQNSKIAFLNQNRKGLLRIAILGSAYLDVSNIETDSLHLQNLAAKLDAKSYELPVIDSINDDSYPDLIVEFEANTKLFNHGHNYAILKGHLADGTIIKGITGPFVLY
jgi:hypothetical protein